jgi:hypothetical protein
MHTHGANVQVCITHYRLCGAALQTHFAKIVCVTPCVCR